VSALMALWFLEVPAFALAESMVRRGRLYCNGYGGYITGFLLIGLWAVFWPWTNVLTDYYLAPTEEWTHVRALGAIHVYFAGMLLAFLMHQRAADGLKPFRNMALISVIILFFIFIFPLDVPIVMKCCGTVGDHLGPGTLMPLHAMLLVGLCEDPEDPLVRLFTKKWPAWLGANFAYTMYILQAPAATFFPYSSLVQWLHWFEKGPEWYHGGGGLIFVFFILFPTIFVFAFICQFFIQKPIQAFLSPALNGKELNWKALLIWQDCSKICPKEPKKK
jgi:hypothetical protein